jgi:dephospho-CoA kinase
MIGPDGAVDRARLGPVVFADEQARRDLETIVHPAVYRAIEAGLRGFAALGVQIAVSAIPLLDETGRHGSFDTVIATVCSPATQLKRLIERGLDEKEAARRMAAQLPAAEKAARADFVIDTDGTFQETDAQVDEILRTLANS